MSRGLIIVNVCAIIGAVVFYNSSVLLSMGCFLIVIASAFTSGKL